MPGHRAYVSGLLKKEGNQMLKKILAAEKEDIISNACSTADYAGKAAWLWMPEKRCPNKRICLVAHIDTVWDRNGLDEWSLKTTTKKSNKRIFYDTEKAVYWSPDGLGADDRAGVYAVLKLRKETGCMILLTDYEESGGLGAKEASKIFKPYFENTAFFLEIDRKGNNEAVFYNGESQEFKNFIMNFGFKEHKGIFSDITIISRDLGIVGANVSAGYYNQHTKSEYLSERYLNSTISKVLKMIREGDKNYDTSRWLIAKEVYSEFNSDNDWRHISYTNRRRWKVYKF